GVAGEREALCRVGVLRGISAPPMPRCTKSVEVTPPGLNPHPERSRALLSPLG
ncbi:hypothetical protein NDU88_006518, partial [Pleurodeles waltl]